MHIAHVVGARPNFVKLAPVHIALAKRNVEQTIIHSGQHYTPAMSDVFFLDLSLPRADINLNVGSATHGVQTGEVMVRLEGVLHDLRPHWVLLYGDVNSTAAAALVCAKLPLRFAHVEAGLRSRDRSMPEEINRLVTDQLADLLFTPSADADENLHREGVPRERIRLVGNVMIDTLMRLLPEAQRRWPDLQMRWGLERFALVTLHRPSNVDDPRKLVSLLRTVAELSEALPVIFPIHPRTEQSLRRARFQLPDSVMAIAPLSYIDFLSLQSHAAMVITDSGGVQEETTFLGVPCLTLRSSTERPITVTSGSNVLVGDDLGLLRAHAQSVIAGTFKRGTVPPLWDGLAAERIADELVPGGS